MIRLTPRSTRTEHTLSLHDALPIYNRKLLLFPLGEVPEMTRGRGVILQKYKDGGLSDAQTFNRKEGLTWAAGAGRVRTETDLRAWIGTRAQAGRLPPTGFPRLHTSAYPPAFSRRRPRPPSLQ